MRSAEHVQAAAIAGADCCTVPPAVFEALFKHPLTEQGLELFIADWAHTGQSIL
jgi:transaldolase